MSYCLGSSDWMFSCCSLFIFEENTWQFLPWMRDSLIFSVFPFFDYWNTMIQKKQQKKSEMRKLAKYLEGEDVKSLVFLFRGLFSFNQMVSSFFPLFVDSLAAQHFYTPRNIAHRRTHASLLLLTSFPYSRCVFRYMLKAWNLWLDFRSDLLQLYFLLPAMEALKFFGFRSQVGDKKMKRPDVYGSFLAHFSRIYLFPLSF